MTWKYAFTGLHTKCMFTDGILRIGDRFRLNFSAKTKTTTLFSRLPDVSLAYACVLLYLVVVLLVYWGLLSCMSNSVVIVVFPSRA